MLKSYTTLFTLTAALWISVTTAQKTTPTLTLALESDEWELLDSRKLDATILPNGDTIHSIQYQGVVGDMYSSYKIYAIGGTKEWSTGNSIWPHTTIEYAYMPGGSNNSHFNEIIGHYYGFTINPTTSQGVLHYFTEAPAQIETSYPSNSSQIPSHSEDVKYTVTLNKNLPSSQKLWGGIYDACSNELLGVYEGYFVQDKVYEVLFPAAVTEEGHQYRTVFGTTGDMSISTSNFSFALLDAQASESIMDIAQEDHNVTLSPATAFEGEVYSLETYQLKNDTWQILDTHSDITGAKELKLNNGEYLFKVVPNGTSFLPTYAGKDATHQWVSAESISTSCEATHTLTFEPAPITPTSGSADISGSVNYQIIAGKTSSDPIEGVQVMLINADNQTAAATTTTDPLGTYEFLQIDTGSYYVEIDLPGYTESNNQEVDLSIPYSDGTVDFELDSITRSISQQIVLNTSISAIESTSCLSQRGRMIWFETTQIQTVDIYNALGSLLFSTTLEVGNHQIDLSHLTQGVYLIQAKEQNSGVNTSKVLLR